MFVILNPKAGGGTARAKWQKIEPQVRDIIGPFTLAVTDDPRAVPALVAHALRHGETEIIAAGGDGTVNLIMASILEVAARGNVHKVKLGAIGLGSSNDFHKPMTNGRMIGDVPFKLDFVSTIRHDVCILTYRDAADELRSRPFLVNASLGTTAEANRFFNEPNRALAFLKKFFPSLGMMYAALRTLLAYRSHKMTITLDETETVHARVKNLGVVKNPHFTGSLSYDSPYEPSSGHVYVHLLRNASLPRLVITLLGLLRGRFSGRKRTQSWKATRLRINSDRPFAVEGDGEVVMASRAYFTVVPSLLRLCS